MPWSTPTLGELRRLSRDHIAARLPGADATVPNSVLRVMSDGNAALAALTLQYLDWLSRQLLPDTAEVEWLDRHAQIWLGGRKAATFATGEARFTGTAGLIIPTATRLSSTGGVEFEVVEAVTLGTNGATGAIRAITPGTSGNLEPGSPITLATAISGVDATATVVRLEGGIDVESDDLLRSRVLERIQKPPMGGDADDYVQWATSIPGVTRAWVAPHEMGIGTVTVRFMMDDLRAGNAGFPSPGDVYDVQAYIDSRRPVTAADVFVVAPVPEPVSFTIQGLAPNDSGTLQSIEQAVRAMLRERAAPAHAVNGVAVQGTTIRAAWVTEAILSAAGVDYFTLDMNDHEMPTPGHLAVPGNIILV